MEYRIGTDADTVIWLKKRVRLCDYLVVAQLFLQSNFLLKEDLTHDDIKPRLLGHWGTCHGINLIYANLKRIFLDDPEYSFILGPGHGFPALQANLFMDGDLEKIDSKATRDLAGLEYICRNFSWPNGFPSHSSPMTPGVICEGGELGYSLGAAYGAVLGHPEKTIAVLIGDGEMETATTLASMNLNKIITGNTNGKVIPILHLNGYKISGPTIYGRKSERELNELVRGFGYDIITIDDEEPENVQAKLSKIFELNKPMIILKTQKGEGGPTFLDGKKIAGNNLAHQIPLQKAKTDNAQLKLLEDWMKSYKIEELVDDNGRILL